MDTPQLKLYVDAQFLSPYAMSAFVTLTEKDVPFELMVIDLATRQHQAGGYASVSLTRRVPALSDGDFHLAESTAIAEYLEERFPAPAHYAVYPPSIRQRAKAREIQAWLRSDLLALRQERPSEVVFHGEGYAPLSENARTAASKLFDAAQRLLDDKEYLFGHWSIADTDLALMINRLALHGDKVPGRLADYARRQWQRPSVQQWVRQAHALKAQAR